MKETHQPAPPVGEVVALAYDRFVATLVRTLPFSLAAVLLGQWPSVYLLQGGESLQLLAPKSPGWWVAMLLSSLGTLWCWLVIARRQWRLDSLSADVFAATRVMPRALAVLLMSAVLVGVGALLLVIPGVYLLIALWPAFAVLLAEDLSARASIDRALVLVRGAWSQSLSVLVVILVLVLGFFVLGALAGFVLSDLLPMSVVTAVLAAFFQPFVTAAGWAQYEVLLARQTSSSASNSL
ncbi:MAG: hypothetical protein ACO329_08125 [Steroidobacteraceae bacterium]